MRSADSNAHALSLDYVMMYHPFIRRMTGEKKSAMYANRYDGSRASRPLSAGAALAINGALVAGLVFAAPEIVKVAQPPIFQGKNIPIDPVPDPDPQPKPKPRDPIVKRADSRIDRVDPDVPLPPVAPDIGRADPPERPSYDSPVGPGPGAGGITTELPARLPVLVGAMIDPAHARDFQPDYPDAMLREGREALVKVRVLVGAGGRIKKVEQVSSPHAMFFEATRRQALSKWHFRTATRDGIPVESWQVMTVRFRITD